jgi:hypothetical protein
MQFKRQQERSEEGADLWSAPAQRSGDGALVRNPEEVDTSPKRCRASLATALQENYTG